VGIHDWPSDGLNPGLRKCCTTLCSRCVIQVCLGKGPHPVEQHVDQLFDLHVFRILCRLRGVGARAKSEKNDRYGTSHIFRRNQVKLLQL
jgi:hypothetical protein